MKNTNDFIKLLADVTNYDNVSFPTLRLGNDLTDAVIVYPKKDKNGNASTVSYQMIELFQKHFNYSGSKEELKLTYKIYANDEGCIEIKVELKS